MDYFKEYSEIFPKLKEASEKIWKFVDEIEKKDLFEIAEKIEQKIFELGFKPAFPVNVGINNVAAHYTPEKNEKIRENDILKIDFGIHLNGFIFDSAKTYGKNIVVDAAKEAFEECLKEVKEGTKVKVFGEICEEVAKKYGLRPVRNLGGHGLGYYLIHAEPTILNGKNNSEKVLIKGMPIALEVFITNGQGKVEDSYPSTIFEIVNEQKIGLLRIYREILEYSLKEFYFLPFCKRWLYKKFPKNKVDFAIENSVKLGILKEYPVLKEIENSIVAQFETTLIVE